MKWAKLHSPFWFWIESGLSFGSKRSSNENFCFWNIDQIGDGIRTWISIILAIVYDVDHFPNVSK